MAQKREREREIDNLQYLPPATDKDQKRMFCSLRLPERERVMNVRRSNGVDELGLLKKDLTDTRLKSILKKFIDINVLLWWW